MHERLPKFLSFCLKLLTLICFGLIVFLTIRSNFNWDETNELSRIFTLESGHEIRAFRNGLIYAGYWLSWLPYSEGTLLILARAFTLLTAGSAILYYTYKIAGRVVPAKWAWAAVFFLVSHHAFRETVGQYRSDVYMTAFYLAALYGTVFRRPNRPAVVVPALLLAAGMLLNPKALYGAVYVGIAWLTVLTLRRRKGRLLRVLLKRYTVATVLTVIFFIGLTVIHCLIFNIGVDAALKSFSSSAETGFGSQHGFSTKVEFLKTLITYDLESWPFYLGGFYLGIRYMRRTSAGIFKTRTPRQTAAVTVVGLAAFITIFFHQGTYKYLIIGLLPPMAVLAAWALWKWCTLQPRVQGHENSRAWEYGLFAVTITFLLVVYLKVGSRLPLYERATNDIQLETIELIKAELPEPVAYADGVGLVGRYRNLLRFHAGKRHRRYTNEEQPLFKDSYFKETLPALILNTGRFSVRRLRPGDEAWLEENYRAYFDRFYLYRIPVPAMKSGEVRLVHSRISGLYRLRRTTSKIKKGGLSVDALPVETASVLPAISDLHEADEKENRRVLYRLPKGPVSIRCADGDCPRAELIIGTGEIFRRVPYIKLIETKAPGKPDLERYFTVDKTDRFYIAAQKYDFQLTVDGESIHPRQSIPLEEGRHSYELDGEKMLFLHTLKRTFAHRFHHR